MTVDPYEPAPRRRLGGADDPDRFDADRFDPDADSPAADTPLPELLRGLDPAYDPDRFAPPAGQGQSLVDLIGKERTHEGERDNYQWAIGLVSVLAFLALVTFLFTSVLTP